MTYQDFIEGKPFTVNGRYEGLIFRRLGREIEYKEQDMDDEWGLHCHCLEVNEKGFKAYAHGLKSFYEETVSYNDLTLYKSNTKT